MAANIGKPWLPALYCRGVVGPCRGAKLLPASRVSTDNQMTEGPPVLDGHNDTVLALWREEATAAEFLDRREDGHLDLPRANATGFAGGFFAVFVPSEPQFDPGADGNRTETEDGYRIAQPPPMGWPYARRTTDEMFALLQDIATDDRVTLVRTADDLRACVDRDQLGLVVHFEGAEAIHPSLSNFQEYYDAGLRSLGLAWSRPTAFADGVPFRYPGSPAVGDGLTDAGRRLVRRCNDRGVVVDCAHLTARGFWDVHDVSTAPLVVSHTAAHEVCPFSRNLTDEQLDAVADTDGVVGLTFSASALRASGQRDDDSLDVVVEHVDHMVDRTSVDHVVLGSDFDGATVLDAVGDVTGVPDVLDALRDAGYSEADCRKIASENWLRVCEATW